MIEPSVGFSSATSSFDTVDLPQPDSPTRPSVSPRASRRFTPSTARTWPTVFLKTMPWVSGKCFFRSRISSSGSPTATVGKTLTASTAATSSSGSDTEDLLAVVAGGLAAGDDEAQLRPVDGAVAARRCLGADPAAVAARVERAAARDVREVRRLALDRHEPAALGLDLRHRAHEALGV